MAVIKKKTRLSNIRKPGNKPSTFIEPWREVDDSRAPELVTELLAELVPDHPLFPLIYTNYPKHAVKAVAYIPEDNNERNVLYQINPEQKSHVVVQLTWLKRPEKEGKANKLPQHELHDSLDNFLQQRMKRDADELDQVWQSPLMISLSQWLEHASLEYFPWPLSSLSAPLNAARLFHLSEYEMDQISEKATTSNAKLKSARGRKRQSLKKRKKLIKGLNHDETFSDIFRCSNSGDEEMTFAWGGQLVRQCEHLFFLANKGNKIAVQFLAEIAIKATKSLGPVTDKHLPELRRLAAWEYAWPVMVSPTKTLNSPTPSWAVLGLGEAIYWDLDPKARPLLRTPMGQFAWMVFNYVENHRKYHATHINTFQGQKSGIKRMLLELPKLSPDEKVIEKWCEVTEWFLAHEFPSPKDLSKPNRNHPLLKGLLPQTSHKSITGVFKEFFKTISGAWRSKKKGAT